eukprot:CAMPEP_0115324834 /NCGR_PEP_ID=MMETSP0270-20121206/82690_1 /TAXON_ID=71861 /ORGANISM="Scrippsiella trochoidea, Strain CCMP3099" /LENGTH=173 /DNA_ID=CAMNT_0002744979 /DNA_START=33 /DNA_END=554 /DNA_ORIENTATION=+
MTAMEGLAIAQTFPRSARSQTSARSQISETKLVQEEIDRHRRRSIKARKLSQNARSVRPLSGFLVQRRPSSDDRKLWIELDPSQGTLTLWDGPPGYMLMEFPRKSRVYKLWRFDHLSFDDRAYELTLCFSNPNKTIHLKASRMVDFDAWRGALQPYSHHSESGSGERLDDDSP